MPPSLPTPKLLAVPPQPVSTPEALSNCTLSEANVTNGWLAAAAKLNDAPVDLNVIRSPNFSLTSPTVSPCRLIDGVPTRAPLASTVRFSLNFRFASVTCTAPAFRLKLTLKLPVRSRVVRPWAVVRPPSTWSDVPRPRAVPPDFTSNDAPKVLVSNRPLTMPPRVTVAPTVSGPNGRLLKPSVTGPVCWSL